MSIRLRLALCYGALFAVILLLVMGLGYAIHARGEYNDLDRTLLVSVDHAAAEAASGDGVPHLIQGKSDLGLALRLFNAHGVLQEWTPGTQTLLSVDPRTVLHAPSGPAYDAVSQFMPSILSTPV